MKMFLIFIMLLFISCIPADNKQNISNGSSKPEPISINSSPTYYINTIVYDSCEYVTVQDIYKRLVGITHKGNCKFCATKRNSN